MITINNIPLKESTIFPGGEVNIRLSTELDHTNTTNLYVKTKIKSSNDLMELILVKDALDFYYPNSTKTLELLYFPYARQDRRCRPGEAWSLKSFVSIIDNLKFTSILTADLHSRVTSEIIKTPLIEISVRDIFIKAFQHYDFNPSRYVIVAPDKGAINRAKSISDYFKCELFVADKKRQESGRISYDEWWDNACLSPNTFSGKKLLIVDDICDGGGTFLSLAEKLNNLDIESLELYVTHGIFSKGLTPLMNADINEIYTTNSIVDVVSTSFVDNIHIWSIT